MRGRSHLLAGLALAFAAGAPALATNLYNSNNPTTGFDATSVGALPTGWVAPSGTWVASTTAVTSTSHTHTFGPTTKAAGNIAVYTGATATADMTVKATQDISSTSSSQGFFGVGARYNAAGNTGYLANCYANSGTVRCNLYRLISGTATQIDGLGASFATPYTYTGSPTQMNVSISTVGTTIKMTAWPVGAAEPSTPTISVTDSSITATGYGALYYNTAGTSTIIGATDVEIDDTPYGETNSIYVLGPAAGSGGSVNYSGLYTGTAPTGFNYALNGSTSFTAVSSPTIGGGTFSFSIGGQAVGSGQATIQASNLTSEVSSTTAYSITSGSGGAATAYTLTGPASGVVGSASTAFTATSNGTLASAVTVTPSDSSGGGTFTPTTVSLAPGTNTSASFTYTPASAGAKTISTTNSSFLTNPSSLIYTASSTTTIAPNNAGIYYSPCNWGVSAAVANTINAGAYFKTIYTGTSVSLNFDMTTMPTNAYSQIWYRIDGEGWVQANVAATIVLNIPAATASITNHLLEVVVKSTTEFTYPSQSGSRWVLTGTKNPGVKLISITLSAGGTVSLPVVYPKTFCILGDSITEGYQALMAYNAGVSDADSSDAMSTFAWGLGRALNAEFGIVGFGGQGVSVGGQGGVPAMTTTYNTLYSGGPTRSFSGLTGVIIMQGGNDGASCSACLAAFKTIMNGITASSPTVPVVMLEEFDGFNAANIQSAIAGSNNPSQFHYVSTAALPTITAGLNSFDGAHPQASLSLYNFAPSLAALVQPILNPVSGNSAASIGGAGINVP